MKEKGIIDLYNQFGSMTAVNTYLDAKSAPIDTWTQILELAKDNPIINCCIKSFINDFYSKEQTLEAMVIALAIQNTNLIKILTKKTETEILPALMIDSAPDSILGKVLISAGWIAPCEGRVEFQGGFGKRVSTRSY